ncbi:lysM domain receptor-like kinase 3 [Dendrobium catenatum]|uniref:LysM domain receptor-like kinase 3 n=1 Tax=Dendrobium catenatum TaxID=906689 RepID=A0A2I0X4Q9_9ASPA|nr:lysM domain receptor-like kinase 3 [Dendrobium catenatum]PKU82877.1 LysM domain receptor-like kinase 3 [Dendrobium catenatum]
MCKARRDAHASQPRPIPSNKQTVHTPSSTSGGASPTIFFSVTNTSIAGDRRTNSSSSRSISSLASLRSSLSDTPTLYSNAEISAATINPVAKHISSSSYRCSLRGCDVFVYRRPFRGDPEALSIRLADVCKSHHRSLVRILGASVCADNIHLVYDFVPGASLSSCLRNPLNPTFTALSSWISRMQVAADLAQGLDYIHHHAGGGGFVHNRIKSSAVIVSESGFNAKICYFGAAFLAGDIKIKKMMRTDSRSVKIEGTRGYLAPEVIAGGSVTRKSDVFAFGVVVLELISGDEPVKYRLGAEKEKRYEWVSLIETAREVVGAAAWEEEGSPAMDSVTAVVERLGRVRRWVDRRLKDSFPLEVAEKMMVVALRCVEGDAAKRPGMSWVQGKISQLFLESKAWSEKIRMPAEISSATFGPR